MLRLVLAATLAAVLFTLPVSTASAGERPVIGWVVNAARVGWWVVHPGWFRDGERAAGRPRGLANRPGVLKIFGRPYSRGKCKG